MTSISLRLLTSPTPRSMTPPIVPVKAVSCIISGEEVQSHLYLGLTVDTHMSSNIAASVYNLDSTQRWQTPYYVCTGNCTWPTITTLGVQASCANLTDRLQINCGNDTANPGCVASLPNGFSLGGDAVMTINSSVQPLFYTEFKNPIALIQSITALTQQG